jgi:hypothetical protein
MPGSKLAGKKFDVERLDLKNLSEVEVREKYQLKISKRFVAIENLNVNKDTNRA